MSPKIEGYAMDNMICHCKGVTEKIIVEAMAKGAKTLADIRSATGAGTGNECSLKNPEGTCCVKDIQAVISRHNPGLETSPRGCGCRSTERRNTMKISILGTGCPKCKKLAENAEAAARDLSIGYDLEKVTDIDKIMEFGVMMTPALAVDGKVVSAGKVLGADDIKSFLGGKASDGAAPPCGCGGGCRC